MKRIRVFTALLSLALLYVAFQPSSKGSDWDKKTVVAINAPVEVPGVEGPKVIGPGTYVFKLMDSNANRNVLQIWNADETKLITTVLALPDYRQDPPDNPIVKFAETAPNSPQAIKEVFYPGDNYGWEFVYRRPQATEIAKANNQNVLSTQDESAEPKTLVKAIVIAITPVGDTADVNTAATPKQ